MQQENTSTTDVALRILGQVVDINMAAMRMLLQAHARAASAFGWPDWSGLFDQVELRARDIFAASAEQMAEATERANVAAIEWQQQLGRVMQGQAVTMADNLRHNLQMLHEQAAGLMHVGDQQSHEDAPKGAQAMQRGGHAPQRSGEMGSATVSVGMGPDKSADGQQQPEGDERMGRRLKTPPQPAVA